MMKGQSGTKAVYIEHVSFYLVPICSQYIVLSYDLVADAKTLRR